MYAHTNNKIFYINKQNNKKLLTICLFRAILNKVGKRLFPLKGKLAYIYYIKFKNNFS